jgi:hypothetical protein
MRHDATTATPPGPAEGFDLGGSDESLARLREYLREFGDVYRVFAPARGVYNYVINHPTTSSTCCCRIIATTPRARAWIGSRSCSATGS